MTMQKKVKIEKIRSDDTDVNYGFRYIRYSNTENSNIESKIDTISQDSTNSDNMFINLSIDITSQNTTTETQDNNIVLNNSILSVLSEFEKLSGNAQKFRFFNKLKKNTNLQLFTKDIKKTKDINVVNEFLGLNVVQNNDFIDYIVNSNDVVVNNDIKENILFQNRSNAFFTSNIENLINDYDKIYKSSFNENEDKELKSIFSGFTPFNKRSIYLGESLLSTSTTFIGIFIEKFVKIGDEYIKIASSYKKSNKINNQNSQILESFDVKDGYIKYGKTYRYAIFPVYLVDIPSFEDFHTYSQYIVCNYPYVTEDILCKEFVRPDPPQAIFFNYYKNSKKMHIEWQRSISEQGDVKGYQIFKRYSIDEPFKLLKQIEFHSKLDAYDKNPNVLETEIFRSNEIPVNEYFDNDFDTSKLNIYAICAIDAHGYISNYSAQIGVIYDFVEGKCIIDTISGQGAPLNYPNLLIPRKTRFIDNDNKLVAITPIKKDFKKATLYITPEFNEVVNVSDDSVKILNDKYKFNILRLDNFKLLSHNINITKQ